MIEPERRRLGSRRLGLQKLASRSLRARAKHPSRLQLSLLSVLWSAGLFALTGCGGLPSAPGHTLSDFSITASSTSVATTDEVRLTALQLDGTPAKVEWSIAGGDNADALGQGRIEPSGLYVPPNSLSSDTVTVKVRAQLASNAYDTQTQLLTIHPSFVEPLMPEVATLALGSAIIARAMITEVGAGRVLWSLSTSPPSARATLAQNSHSLGTLSTSRCQYKSQQYTTCTVLYTTPKTLPTGAQVYLLATINGNGKTVASKILLNDHQINSTPAANQAIQHGEAFLGSSGGNDHDYDTYTAPSGERYIADCCGGTLGALVEDARGQAYVLSNNHVLAESDQASAGDAIVQPGLMDGACTPLADRASKLHAVGRLAAWVRLSAPKTNVDAALASVLPGQISAQGAILALGSLHRGLLGAAPPMAGTGEALTAENLGMEVAKSGRTTGLTCSHLAAVDLSVKVNYYRDCAETQPYLTKTFRHQIAVEGANFTDSGDSGALVVNASNAEAIGLYFAGGTDGQGQALSLVNPIHDVLEELGQTLGSPLTLVGTKTPHAVTCIDYGSSAKPDAALIPARWQTQVRAALATPAFAALLTSLGPSTVLGTASGESLDAPGTQAAPGTPAIVFYVDAEHSNLALPATFDGLRTQVIVTTKRALALGLAPKQPAPEYGLALSATELKRAEDAVTRFAPTLLAHADVIGLGAAESLDRPHEAALLVLLKKDEFLQKDSPAPVLPDSALPATLGGLRVRYLRLEDFYVTRERMFKSAPPTSCAVAGTSHSNGQAFWVPDSER